MMREEGLSMFASVISMPFAARAFAEEDVAERVMPRTFQPSERKVLATEPPCGEEVS